MEINWQAIASIAALLTLMSGAILRFRSSLQADIDKLRDEFAVTRSDVAVVREDIADFRVEVADHRATNRYVAEVESRLTEMFRRLDSKMDRLLEIHGDKK